MTREEIVTALRLCGSYDVNDCKPCPLRTNTECHIALTTAAADLIENQQRHIEALLQANAALRDTVLRRDAQIEKIEVDRKALLNELCQYCGKYKQAHEGACDGCKWREM